MLPKWYRLCGSEDLEALSIVTVQIIPAQIHSGPYLTNLLRFATLIDIPFCGDRELLFAPPYCCPLWNDRLVLNIIIRPKLFVV